MLELDPQLMWTLQTPFNFFFLNDRTIFTLAGTVRIDSTPHVQCPAARDIR